ncbi:MAG: Bor/Iss family lipoprotein [Gemmatimonadales bacterium]
MRLVNHLALSLAITANLSACYHAVIETGATPSTQVVEEKWAASWLEGLVPPKMMETAAKCPGGVARVETRMSFLNRVAAFLTLGIYTPMHVTATCAASSSADAEAMAADVIVPDGDTAAQVEAVNEGARLSMNAGRAVLLRFE